MVARPVIGTPLVAWPRHTLRMSTAGQPSNGEGGNATNSSELEMAEASASIYGTTREEPPSALSTSTEKGTGSASISPSPSPQRGSASGTASNAATTQKKSSASKRKTGKVKKTLRRVSVVTKEKVDLQKAKVASEKATPRQKYESNALIPSLCSKHNINAVLNHTAFTIVDALLTFYVLLIPNVQDLFVPVSADEALYVMNILIFTFFLVEVFILTFAEEGYAPRTYFWLDVVATRIADCGHGADVVSATAHAHAERI